ncbi:MAG: hypothetical protein KBA82_02195 [Nitrosomonas sp.]|nr:hypothetical protein [Nitrosomonas sp.]MBP7111790.1 hypothetical protein [Nitrosomonas sp.]
MDTHSVKIRGIGWLRDLPDFRDYTPEHEKIESLLAKINIAKPVAAKSLPDSADLRTWCSSIEDQLDLDSCTAQAGAGLIEFYENRAFGTHTDVSRLFLYKATRNLLGWTDDWTPIKCMCNSAQLIQISTQFSALSSNADRIDWVLLPRPTLRSTICRGS